MRIAARVRGTEHLILTQFGESDSPTIEWDGAVGKFTDIPEDAEWLDTRNLKAADDTTRDRIIIPPDLKPNYESFFCCLFPKHHIFVFETYGNSKSLSPFLMKKWMEAVVKHPNISSEFGQIEVDLLPDYQLVEQIINSESIREIEITIRRTNPDHLGEDQFRRSEEKLRELNAIEERTFYKAEKNEHLRLDDEVKSKGRVGAENGEITAKIDTEVGVKRVSTERHPLEAQDLFNPDVTPPISIFRSLASRILGEVIRNRSART